MPHYSRALPLQLTTRIILINNTNNLFQQHCAQNNTLGAQGGFVKDNGRQFNCQLKSIRGCFLFGLEECAWRIGNPKQKLRGDRKKGTIYERTLQRRQQGLF